ncbi:MAG: hypothetical protein K940chlam3_01234 [Chlamydiae bacterium]|nr:hypothetical protein [Chlamydiota bacterium]
MDQKKKLEFSLLLLRLGVFIVMFMWTIDKIMRPEHSAAVFEKFYFISGFGTEITIALGVLELVIIIGFLLGLYKTWTYGLVLLFHFISTISTFNQYLSPFEGTNLLFFAAWPMLAACICLFLMRKQDRMLSVT